jgi:hypothetical protein
MILLGLSIDFFAVFCFLIMVLVVIILFVASLVYLINNKAVKGSELHIGIFYLLLIVIPIGSYSLAGPRIVNGYSFPTASDIALLGLGTLLSVFVVFIYIMNRKKKKLEESEDFL